MARQPSVVLLLLALVVSSGYAQTITSVSTSPTELSPAQGSTEGHTLLYLRGVGFAETHFSNTNQVFIAGTECKHIPYFSTSTMVVCETAAVTNPAHVDTPLPIQLIIDGVRNAQCSFSGGCTFTYVSATPVTPTVSHVVPISAAALDHVTLIGALGINAVTGVRDLSFGDGVCGVTGDDSLDEDTLWASNTAARLACVTAEREAGYADLKLTITDDAGRAAYGPHLAQATLDDTVYAFAYTPAITALSTTQSSALGGAEIEIQGTGFSRVASNNVVTFAGQPCAVTDASLHALTCVTAAEAASADLRGGRGMRHAVYVTSDSLSTFLAAPSPPSPDITGRQDAAEAPLNADHGGAFIQSLVGVYTAPRSGAYTFSVASSGAAALYLNAAGPDASGATEAVRTWWSPFRNFAYAASQTSAPVSLTAGDQVYVALYGQHASASNYLSLAVRVPSGGAGHPNSVHELQTIAIDATVIRETHVLEVNATSGAFALAYGDLWTQVIPYDATAATLEDALEEVVPGAVTVAAATHAAGTRWSITLNYPLEQERPLMGVSGMGLSPGASTSVRRITEASPVVAGTWSVTWGSATTPQLAHTVSAGALEAALEAITGEPLHVTASGNPSDGQTFTVEFLTPGGVNAAAFVPATHSLTGGATGAAVVVTTVRDGSEDQWFAPIPGDHVATLEATTQLRLTVNGVSAACELPGTDNACDAVYVTAPTITGISPQLTSGVCHGDTTLTITGTSLGTSLTLSLGGSPCLDATTGLATIDVAAGTSFSCDPQHGRVGAHAVQAVVDGVGLTDPASSSYTFIGSITGVSPSTGAVAGGIPITIAGCGFGADPALLAATVGGVTCPIVSADHAEVVCTLPAASATGGATVAVSVDGSPITDTSSFAYVSGPSISGVTPSSAGVLDTTTLTIAGAGFSAAPSVALALQSDPQVVSTCTVDSYTTGEIVCTVTRGHPGVHDVLVTVPGVGDADGAETFSFDLEITSLTRNTGGTLGGTELTVNGNGFPAGATTDMLVLIGGVPAKVTAVTSSTVHITTGAWVSTSNSGALLVEVRAKDYATVCTACFSYVASITPQITAVTDASALVAGASVTFSGTALPASTADAAVHLVAAATGNAAACTVTAASASSVTVTVPALVAGAYSWSFVDPVAGGRAAWASAALADAALALTVDAVSPTTAPTGGATVTVSGSGFPHSPANALLLIDVAGVACVIVDPDTDIDADAGTATCVLGDGTALAGSPHNVHAAVRPRVGVHAGAVWSPADAATQAAVAGAEASCGGASACQFTWVATAAPTLSGVAQSATAGASITLTLTGTGFELVSPLSANTVAVGGLAATVTSVPDANTIIATLADAPAGTWAVQVHVSPSAGVAGYASHSPSPVTVTIDAVLSSISPATGGYAGGTHVTIAGTGLARVGDASSAPLFLCGAPCTPSATPGASSLECTTAPLITDTSVAAYGLPGGKVASILDASTSFVATRVTSTAAAADDEAVAFLFDGAIGTAWTAADTSCEVTFDVGAHTRASLHQIRLFPRADLISGTSDAARLAVAGAAIEGSNDASSWDTLHTFALAELADGWSVVDLDSPSAGYRYLRLASAANTAGACALSELDLRVSKRSLDGDTDGLCGVTYAGTTLADAYTYTAGTSTPTVTAVTPATGSTLGGTRICVTGTGFSGSTDTLVIDGVDCVYAEHTGTTEWCCDTGARPTQVSPSTFVFSVAGTGVAAHPSGPVSFLYIDRWSDAGTWGGAGVPGAGESVHIPAGQTVLFDVDTPQLELVLIEGTLVWEDVADLELTARYVFVKGGHLIIGTEATRHQHRAVITLVGSATDPVIPVYGTKVLAVREGTLDLHGQDKATWTVLNADASAGATTITVADAVAWEAGDEIAVAASGHDATEVERHTIASISGTSITLESPLAHAHTGSAETLASGDALDRRTEVVLVSQNIVIRGDPTSADTGFGAHVFIHSHGDDSSITRAENVQLSHCGQEFSLGRYPWHWHRLGRIPSSYLRRASVSDSFNRAVAFHAVEYATVEECVAVDIRGHAIVMWDGAERHNTITNNVVMRVHASHSLLNTDSNPAAFWITNPDNALSGNRAIASDRSGFWFDHKSHSTGASADAGICPNGDPLGLFADNVAHSNTRTGVRIFDTLVPRTNPCGSATDYVGNPRLTASLDRIVSYSNGRSGVLVEQFGDVRLIDTIAADNLWAGIEMHVQRAPLGTATIDGAIISGPAADVGARGIEFPRSENFALTSAHLMDFATGSNVALRSCSRCDRHPTQDQGVRTTYLQGLTFTNCGDNVVAWNFPHKGVFIDEDGSLTGITGGTAAAWWPHLEIPGTCDAAPSLFLGAATGGLVCDASTRIRRLVIDQHSRRSNLDFRNVVLHRDGTDLADAGRVPWLDKADPDRAWAVPVATGQTYGLWWDSWSDFERVRLTAPLLEAGDHVMLRFNYTEERAGFTITQTTLDTGISVALNVSNTTLPDPATDAHGAAFWNATAKTLTVLLSGDTDPASLTINALRCPPGGCVFTPPKPRTASCDNPRRWSNASAWDTGVVPGDGATVIIDAAWCMLIDVPVTATLKRLQVEGVLLFDPARADAGNHTELRAESILIRGGLLGAGAPGAPLSANGTATITLVGDRDTDFLVVDNAIDAGNKVLAVFGELALYGATRDTWQTTLRADASAGATSIVVDAFLDGVWLPGDEILITGSGFEGVSEVRTLTAVSGNTLTFAAPLAAYHHGDVASEVTLDGVALAVDGRARVALLSRNIRIQGSPTTLEQSHGCHVLAGRWTETAFGGLERVASVHMEGVAVSNCGQADTLHFAVNLDEVGGAANLTGVAITGSWMTALGVTSTRALGDGRGPVSVTDLVIHDTQSSAVRVMGGTQEVSFTRALVDTTHPRPQTADQQVDVIAAYELCVRNDGDPACSGIRVTDSAATAGSTAMGYIHTGVACDDTGGADSPFAFSGNVAHGMDIGVFVQAHVKGSGACTRFNAGGFNAWWSASYGAFYLQKSDLVFSDAVVANNAVGLVLQHGREADNNHVDVSRVAVVGATAGASSGCDLASGDTCEASPGCGARMGVMASNFGTSTKPLPPTASALPWHKVKLETAFHGLSTWSHVHLDGWAPEAATTCGARHRVIELNPDAFDATHPMHWADVSHGPAYDADALTWLEEPNPAWLNEDDCPVINCVGRLNVVLRGDDGTLTGAPRQVIIPGMNPTAAIDGCDFVVPWNAFLCATNTSYRMLTLESRDHDRWDRSLHPVYLGNRAIGFESTMASMGLHRWWLDVTSLKRLSRFPVAIPMGVTINATFTSTPAYHFRAQLQNIPASGYGASDASVLTLHYDDSRSVHVSVIDATPEERNTAELHAAGPAPPPMMVPVPYSQSVSLHDPTGTNYWDPVTKTLTVSLSGSQVVLLDMHDAVHVAFNFALSLDDFFADGGDTTFIQRLALVLNINAGSIRVTKVVSVGGSSATARRWERIGVRASTDAVVYAIVDGVNTDDPEADAETLEGHASTIRGLSSLDDWPIRSVTAEVTLDPERRVNETAIASSSSDSHEATVIAVSVTAGVLLVVMVGAAIAVWRWRKRDGTHNVDAEKDVSALNAVPLPVLDDESDTSSLLASSTTTTLSSSSTSSTSSSSSSSAALSSATADFQRYMTDHGADVVSVSSEQDAMHKLEALEGGMDTTTTGATDTSAGTTDTSAGTTDTTAGTTDTETTETGTGTTTESTTTGTGTSTDDSTSKLDAASDASADADATSAFSEISFVSE